MDQEGEKAKQDWRFVGGAAWIGAIGYLLYLNAWQFLVGVLAIGVLCGIGIISDIMERPRPRQDHEKPDAPLSGQLPR